MSFTDSYPATNAAFAAFMTTMTREIQMDLVSQLSGKFGFNSAEAMALIGSAKAIAPTHLANPVLTGGNGSGAEDACSVVSSASRSDRPKEGGRKLGKRDVKMIYRQNLENGLNFQTFDDLVQWAENNEVEVMVSSKDKDNGSRVSTTLKTKFHAGSDKHFREMEVFN